MNRRALNFPSPVPAATGHACAQAACPAMAPGSSCRRNPPTPSRSMNSRRPKFPYCAWIAASTVRMLVQYSDDAAALSICWATASPRHLGAGYGSSLNRAHWCRSKLALIGADLNGDTKRS
jgi:hypothetical protein